MRKDDIKSPRKPFRTEKKAETSPQSVKRNISKQAVATTKRTIKTRGWQEDIINFDLKALLEQWYAKADKPFWSAFLTAFIGLNVIFLYHGAHFLFGDHDWQYLKEGVPVGAGLFEGRFTQFIPINILSRGEIYPIINNILGFAGFSLGIALLAQYWNIPHQKKHYTLFALLSSITPYILSFMYFAFLVIPVLGWNAFVIGALVISEKEQRFSLVRTTLAVLLIIMAMGGYPPVINLIAVVLSVKLLINSLRFSPQTGLAAFIKDQYKRYKWSIFNLIIGLIVYKLCLWGLEQTNAVNTSYYNLQTTPISEWFDKFLLVSKDVIRQFMVTLPFITTTYKSLTALLVILGLGVIIRHIANKSTSLPQKIATIILTTIIFYAPLVTLFISTSLAETEFSPRIDFFGLMYLYAGFFAIVQNTPHTTQLFKNIGNLLGIMIILTSVQNLFEAEKVWKLGFDAEMKLYRRAAARIMSSPVFSLNQKYIMIQGGIPSYRPRYYHENYEISSADLLDISYVPTQNSGVMWNYYAPKEFAETISYAYTLLPDANTIEQIRRAQNWPHKNSAAISILPWQQYQLEETPQTLPTIISHQHWIMLLLTEDGAQSLRRNYGL